MLNVHCICYVILISRTELNEKCFNSVCITHHYTLISYKNTAELELVSNFRTLKTTLFSCCFYLKMFVYESVGYSEQWFIPVKHFNRLQLRNYVPKKLPPWGIQIEAITTVGIMLIRQHSVTFQQYFGQYTFCFWSWAKRVHYKLHTLVLIGIASILLHG